MKNKLLLPILISVSIPVVIGGAIATAVLINHSSRTSSVSTSAPAPASTPLSVVNIKNKALQYIKNGEKSRIWEQRDPKSGEEAPDYARGLVYNICDKYLSCNRGKPLPLPIRYIKVDGFDAVVSILPVHDYELMRDFMIEQSTHDIKGPLDDLVKKLGVMSGDEYVPDKTQNSKYSFVIVEDKAPTGASRMHVELYKGFEPVRLVNSDEMSVFQKK